MYRQGAGPGQRMRVLALILLLSLLLRRLLDHGSEHLGRWTGVHWLEGIGQEAKRRGRAFIFP